MTSGQTPPSVRIITLGCAKNTVDSEVMNGLLKDEALSRYIL